MWLRWLGGGFALFSEVGDIVTMENISQVVDKVVLKYRERDPFRLAKAMKIKVLSEPMGDYEEACKGFFMIQSRKKVIVINSDLPEMIQRIILTHEIGHAVLHAPMLHAVKTYHDFSLCDATDRTEYEANLFAADFLLRDDEVIAKLKEDNFFFGVASEFMVPLEMLDFKFRILKAKKLLMLESPISAHGDFLKKLSH